VSRRDEDRGALLGEGLFETVLLIDGAPLAFEEHIDRLRRSAGALGLPVPSDDDVLCQRAAADVGWEQVERPRRAVLRVTLTCGTGRGLVPGGDSEPRLSGIVTPLPAAPDRTPLRAVTVAAHRVGPAAAISGHKVLSWLPWVLARREALARGADVALIRTIEGDVCEADHANVFVVARGVVVTPSLDRGVLPGITRARILDVLRSAGREVEERVLTDEDLDAADEAWLTSSLDGVRALSAIDHRFLDAPGAVTLWLASCDEGN